MAEVKKVFLSSTGRDLSEYREAAYKAIEGLEGYHCVRMEDFGARDWVADEFCRTKVAECDLFVGILGLCYGSSPKGKQKSYTEREYEAAIAAKLPRLMFLAPDDFPVPGDLIESDEERAKQRAFRDRVSAELVRDTFTSAEDLARRVEQAIFNWALSREKAKPEAAAGPAALVPLPPPAHFVHPYPLQRNFTGRVRERGMLTEWLTKDDRPVLAMIAIGGMGKSALTWAWVQRDVLGLPLPGAPEDKCHAAEACRVPGANKPEGIFWYSFYEREATFQNFLNAALAYCSGGKVDPTTVPSIHERMQALYNLLCGNRFLMMLDGLERILRAYASLGAAYQGDVVEEDKRGDFRSCTDRNSGEFFRWLTSGAMKSRVVITSRLFPLELDDIGGCRRESLEGFDPEDARIFFQNQGIECTRAEVEDVCGPYGCQPLALRLLAGLITEDPERPNDISVAAGHKITEDLRGKEQHHILERAYDALGKGERGLLGDIAASRYALEYGTLQAIFGPREEKREAEKAFRFESLGALKEGLKRLVRRGLLVRQEGTGRYDLNPIVRQYAYGRLADKGGTHMRLWSYFSAVPAPETERVEKIEDLAPVIELYHHTVRAGNRYEDALTLYNNKLAKPLYSRFSAYQLCVELLRDLFPEGPSPRPEIEDKSSQASALSSLGHSYALSGQPRLAARAYEVALDLMREGRTDAEEAITLDSLVFLAHLPLGRLSATEKRVEDYLGQLGGTRGGRYAKAAAQLAYGRLLSYQGHFDKAKRQLDAALDSFVYGRALKYEGTARASQGVCALLMGDVPGALEVSGSALQLARLHGHPRDIIEAEWLAGAANLALAARRRGPRGKVLSRARNHVEEALTLCRRKNVACFEPDILLTWGRWHRAKGEADRAKGDAEEAMRIADRCEYRLKQAEIHNFLARLAMDEGNHDEAKKEAEIAYERAWCDGPPHCYKPAMDEAEGMLKELGAEPPKMD